MSAKDYLKKICIHTCIYFTATTLLLLLLYVILSLDLSSGIYPPAQVCILPFSFLLAAANVFFRYATDWGIGWRVSIHYALTLGSAFVFLYLPQKADSEANGLILFVVMTVLYAVIMGILLGIRARIRRVTRDESRYKSLYGGTAAKNSKNGKSKKQSKDDYQSVFKKK